MGEQTITLATSAAAGDPMARWWKPIAAAWPRQAGAPDFRLVPLQDLAMQVHDAGLAERLVDQGPLLIVLGPDLAGSALLRLVDDLQQQMLPAVLLFPTVDGPTRRLQGGGVLIEAWDADPGFIAAALYTLTQRQTTVRSLSRDLAIAARYQGGVSGEIDRIHDELNLAASVQQEMLPRRMPEGHGLQFGILFRPAGYVSGDIYDVVELDEGGRHIGFFIADAVGHGVPAALMTMVISRSLRMTRALERGGTAREIVSPGEAMTRLNDELCRGKRESPRFTTAVYGVIDTASRRITLAGAGHPPPLRIRGRCLTRVETDGPLLGVFPGERYSDTSFTLAEDETLLLYSDGFETAFSASDPVTGKRKVDYYLTELASLTWPGTTHTGTAADALRDLERRLDAQAGSLHQIDDMTAVAISARATAAELPVNSRAAA